MQQPLDATEAFGDLGRIKLSDTDLNGVLAKIAELARRTIPGAEDVSVTLVRGSGAHTAAFTGQLALTLDEWQYQQGAGPCLDAAAAATVVSVPDISTDERWPSWATAARGQGVYSSLSIGLPVQESVVGALNIYGTKPQAFDDDAIALAQAFAGYAAVAMANAHLYDTTASLAHHMQAAMESRAVIEQAKGIIMGARRCTAEEAFAILVKLSQDTNRKLRDVAITLVNKATGTAP
ncbi:GAF and ANTAR domain-containing protein [Asanoa sp. NPDC049518]|uniref:GAF and ANTAR domain-containing protein n=1 Tax=unclassified Asanoa TaxID=2685164 RepID=UPI003437AD6F